MSFKCYYGGGTHLLSVVDDVFPHLLALFNWTLKIEYKPHNTLNNKQAYK